jgi:hypothetical protein
MPGAGVGLLPGIENTQVIDFYSSLKRRKRSNRGIHTRITHATLRLLFVFRFSFPCMHSITSTADAPLWPLHPDTGGPAL